MGRKRCVLKSGFCDSSEIRLWFGRLNGLGGDEFSERVIQGDDASRMSRALGRSLRTPAPKVVLKGMNKVRR